MKKVTLLQVLSLIIMSMPSCIPCGGDLDCDGYNGAELYDWFPYNETNKTFAFATINGDHDTLVIGDITKSEYYHVDKKGPFCGHETCKTPKGTIESKIDNRHPHWVIMNIKDTEYYNDNRRFTLTYKQYQIALKIREGYIELVNNNVYKIEHFTTSQLNGKNYNDVIVIETTDNATATAQGIYKLYIAKGMGIIGYKAFPVAKQYWLQ